MHEKTAQLSLFSGVDTHGVIIALLTSIQTRRRPSSPQLPQVSCEVLNPSRWPRMRPRPILKHQGRCFRSRPSRCSQSARRSTTGLNHTAARQSPQPGRLYASRKHSRGGGKSRLRYGPMATAEKTQNPGPLSRDRACQSRPSRIA